LSVFFSKIKNLEKQNQKKQKALKKRPGLTARPYSLALPSPSLRYGSLEPEKQQLIVHLPGLRPNTTKTEKKSKSGTRREADKSALKNPYRV